MEVEYELDPIIEMTPTDDFEPDDVVTDEKQTEANKKATDDKKAPADSDRILDPERMLPLATGMQKQFLDRHNLYRCMHGVQPVQWNTVMYNDVESTFKYATKMEHSDSFSRSAAQGGP